MGFSQEIDRIINEYKKSNYKPVIKTKQAGDVCCQESVEYAEVQAAKTKRAKKKDATKPAWYHSNPEVSAQLEVCFKMLKTTTQDRINYILAMNKIVTISCPLIGKWLGRRRAAFNRMKTRIYPFNKNTVCYCCGALACHRHHKISLMNGGENTADNIVPLCESCHKIIHPWLNLQNKD